MQNGYAQYTKGTSDEVLGRDSEIVAFTLANAGLSAASDCLRRIDALYRNQQLWSALMRDIALDNNRLPDELKRQIVLLGTWTARYSIRAMSEDWSLAPLIAVNGDIIEGLRAQSVASRPALAPAPPSRLDARLV